MAAYRASACSISCWVGLVRTDRYCASLPFFMMGVTLARTQ